MDVLPRDLTLTGSARHCCSCRSFVANLPVEDWIAEAPHYVFTDADRHHRHPHCMVVTAGETASPTPASTLATAHCSPLPPPPPQRHRPSPTTTTTTTAWCCVGILNAKAAPRAGRGAVPRGGAAGGEHDELHGDHAHLPQHAGGSAASWLCYAMLRSDMLCYDMIWHSMLC